MNHKEARNMYNRAYRMWKKMFLTANQRIGVKVAPEWLDFSNFYNWYLNNKYDSFDGKLSLHYNLIDKKNTYICPEKCVLIPTQISNLFQYRDVKNRDLPHGVVKTGKLYTVTIRNPIIKEVEYVGSAKTPEEAFELFRDAKNQIIWGFVKAHKYELPNNIYNLLMSYRVELDD